MDFRFKHIVGGIDDGIPVYFHIDACQQVPVPIIDL